MSEISQILLVEDDQDDVEMILEILKRSKIPHQLNSVDDGVKGLDYLNRRGEFQDSKRPQLIILDLNLPKKDGRRVLQEIKATNDLKSIPVVVFTTSKADSDIAGSYLAGANCFITKPKEFSEFATTVKAIESFWFSVVDLFPETHPFEINANAVPIEAQELLRILLVEDDLGDVEYYREVLNRDTRVALTLDVAENLTSAITRIQKKKYEVILLDLGLSESQGLATFTALLPHTQGTPVVVLTGLADENIACEAIRLGAQDYILKDQSENRTVWRVLRYAIERKHVLKNLQTAREELEIRVRERTEELSEANKKLCREVRERTKAEKEAKESEVRFKRLADSTFEGLLIHKHNKIIDANQAAAKLYGCEVSEIVGRDSLYFTESSYRSFAKTKIESNDERPFETLDLRVDGTTFPAEVQTRSLSNEEGSLKVVVVRDVTERKLVEQMRERNIALKESNETLQQFASVASHDLKEPLRSLSGLLALLKKESENQLSPKGLDYLNLAIDGSARMRRLVDDLLSYTRIAQSPLQLVPVDMKAVLKEAIGNLKGSIEDTGATIRFPSLPKVMGNAGQLVRLIENFLSNAIKFRKTNCIPEISISVNRQENNQLTFKIKDNGIGFDDKRGDEIFAMFRTLNDPEAYPGTGIGLATCKKIIENHKGKTWAESKIGLGSSFSFVLQGIPAIDLSGTTILIAEDAKDMAILTSHLLKEHGAVVEIAKHGREAVEKNTRGNYDLILMDIQMPFLDGIEATAEIRKAGFTGAIIAFTGHRREGSSEYYRARGFTDYLCKDNVLMDGEADGLVGHVFRAVSTVTAKTNEKAV